MFGSIGGGLSAGKAYEAQAVERRLASVYRRLKAQDDAEDIRDEGERLQAEQAARYAKSGVMLDSGSPLLTLMDTAIRSERNALRTMLYGEREAESLERSASDLMRAGSAARLTGMAGAAGAGLTGYLKISGQYKKPKVAQG